MFKNLLVFALIAGLFFGTWPLLMNRSGLTGFLSAGVFAFFTLLVVIPFALSGGLQSLHTADWKYAVLAGIAGAIGLLAFTSMLSQASPEKVGSLFIVTLLAQIMVPTIYDIAMTGNLPYSRMIGVIAAIVAVILLK